MDRARPGTADLHCHECGQLPEVSKTRLTVANVLTVLPIEILVHALVVGTSMPYLAKVLTLAVTATAVVIWVAEPSARRLLRRWLHAPALRSRRRVHASAALWRVRTVLPDGTGTLERITHGFTRLDANILSIHVHRVSGGVLDEFILSAPGTLTDDELVAEVEAWGGRDTRVWPTSAVALTDGQSRALSLATRIAHDPDDLAATVAELLSAEHLDEAAERMLTPGIRQDGTLIKIPTSWHGPLYFLRPGDPFTPAEAGRAHRLAELAEVVTLGQARRPAPRRKADELTRVAEQRTNRPG
ncbi:amino acid-binding protein [Cryobacterium melibiosiphilum]|uniref:amino acid-binding protein n=1 Tax=Cryobacterium melibiosiphilum TaxID=995039 RepID=UPI001F42DACB|nr:amino acid-binding protein [Cryobacterium melibiosiphilum]